MKKKTCSFRAGLAVALSVASLTSGAVLAGAAPASVALAASGISESKARMIALKDAGFSSHQVLGLDTDDDKQDGKKIYEVVFFKKTGDRKYDKYRYVIAYKDGKILKHSKRDIRIITKQQALHEALYKKHFSRSQVYDVDVDLDEDDGMIVYEVDYTSRDGANGGPSLDFEFTINAENGKVVDWDWDDD